VAIDRAGLYWVDLALIPSVLALIGLIGERLGKNDKGGRNTPKKNYTWPMKKFLMAILCVSLLTGCVQTEFDSDPNDFIEPLP
jgi:hypothetical protein